MCKLSLEIFLSTHQFFWWSILSSMKMMDSWTSSHLFSINEENRSIDFEPSFLYNQWREWILRHPAIFLVSSMKRIAVLWFSSSQRNYELYLHIKGGHHIGKSDSKSPQTISTFLSILSNLKWAPVWIIAIFPYIGSNHFLRIIQNHSLCFTGFQD